MDGAPVICFQKIQFRPMCCKLICKLIRLMICLLQTPWYAVFRPRVAVASAWGPTELPSEQLFNEPLGCKCGVLHSAGCSPNTKYLFKLSHVFQRFSMSFSDPLKILKALACVVFFLSRKSQKSQSAKVREAILQRRAGHPENGHLQL